MIKRAIFGAIYVLLVVSSLLYSSHSLWALVIIFTIGAAAEFFKVQKKITSVEPLLAILLGTSVFLSIFLDKLFILIPILIVYFIVLLFYYLFVDEKNLIQLIGLHSLFLIWIISPFALTIYFANIIEEANYYILGTFVLIWVNDTFAYLVGKSIGKNKLLSTISPNKTIEGFLAGSLFTLLLGLGLFHYYDNVHWATISIIVSLTSSIGDLIESKVKRSYGIKDFGNIMPGHGGVLDRLDSYLFTFPIVFVYFYINKFL